MTVTLFLRFNPADVRTFECLAFSAYDSYGVTFFDFTLSDGEHETYVADSICLYDIHVMEDF